MMRFFFFTEMTDTSDADTEIKQHEIQRQSWCDVMKENNFLAHITVYTGSERTIESLWLLS